MHELSIAMSILEFAEEEAQRRGSSLTAVHVKIGALSGVVREALISAFDVAKEVTSIEGCKLVIEEVPIVIHCVHCKQDCLIPSVQDLCCPACGRPAADFLQGRELQVVGLELAA